MANKRGRPRKHAIAPLLTIAHDVRQYLVTKSGRTNRITWDYAHNKTCVLVEWLAEQGVAFMDMPPRDWLGTDKGYYYFVEVCKEAEAWHRETGLFCWAMLNKELIGYEGRAVWCIDAEGTQYEFIVGKRCLYCPVHLMLSKAGNRNGKRVPCTFTHVEVKHTIALMNGRVQICKKPR